MSFSPLVVTDVSCKKVSPLPDLIWITTIFWIKDQNLCYYYPYFLKIRRRRKKEKKSFVNGNCHRIYIGNGLVIRLYYGYNNPVVVVLPPMLYQK